MENKRLHTAVVVWANFCRFLLAFVFTFSGFIKANDPLGTVYKMEDYLEAWGILELMPGALIYLAAMLMGVVEFTLGVYLLFGIRRRMASSLVLFLMSVMTPLTLWLAVANPVSDCGCFGDAVILTNWETFAKNVVLLVAAVSVFKWRRTVVGLVTGKVDWLVALYSTVFIVIYTFFCIDRLPVFDFRPYHIGADIRKGMEIPEGETPTTYETTFIYAKNGVEKEFTIDDFPSSDSTWVFVDSRTRIKEKGYEPPIHDFSIMAQEDGTDLTDEVLDDEGYTFLLVAPQLSEADDSNIDLINEVFDYSMEHGYRFLCVTASTDEDIATWQENTGAEYPFALMDDITLKTMIRSNPGLMLLKKGVVVNKWGDGSLPDEYRLNAPLEKLPIGQLNRKTVSHKIAEVVMWFVVPLLTLTLCDLAWLNYRNRKAKKESQAATDL